MRTLEMEEALRSVIELRLQGIVAESTQEVLIALCVLIVILGLLFWLLLHISASRSKLGLGLIAVVTVIAIRIAPGFFPPGEAWIETAVQSTAVIGGMCATVIWAEKTH